MPRGVRSFPQKLRAPLDGLRLLRKSLSLSLFVSICVMFGCGLWGPLFSPVAGGRPGRRCWGKSSSKSSPSVRQPACLHAACFLNLTLHHLFKPGFSVSHSHNWIDLTHSFSAIKVFANHIMVEIFIFTHNHSTVNCFFLSRDLGFFSAIACVDCPIGCDTLRLCVYVCLLFVISIGGTELHPLVCPQHFCSLTYTSTAGRQQRPQRLVWDLHRHGQHHRGPHCCKISEFTRLHSQPEISWFSLSWCVTYQTESLWFSCITSHWLYWFF